MPHDPVSLAGNEAFYQGHLDRVSRSFAFCIRELQAPMRGWVGLSYLLCRILDTLEDAPWPLQELAAQEQHFASFRRFVTQPTHGHEITAWGQGFPAPLDDDEQALIDDAPILLAHLHALDTAVKSVILRAIETMQHGMRHFASRRRALKVLQLFNLGDVDRYCYVVAGVVGELLLDLFILAHAQTSRSNWQPPDTMRHDAVHFGLCLQKINVLKDQRSDEMQGRYLVPSRSGVQRSLMVDAERALNFICALPTEARPFRIFCAWSLFLGAQSMPFIDESFSDRKPRKISRQQTQAMREEISGLACDNEALTAAFMEAKMNFSVKKDSKQRAEHEVAQTNEALFPEEDAFVRWVQKKQAISLSPITTNNDIARSKLHHCVKRGR